MARIFLEAGAATRPVPRGAGMRRTLTCVEIKILRRVRRLLDSAVVLVPHRSTEPGRPRHRREMT